MIRTNKLKYWPKIKFSDPIMPQVVLTKPSI